MSVWNFLRQWKGKSKKKTPEQLYLAPEASQMISGSLNKNKRILDQAYQDCADVIQRVIRFGEKGESGALLVYLEGTANVEEIDEHVIKSLQKSKKPVRSLEDMKQALSVTDAQKIKQFADVFKNVSDGKPVLFLDGVPSALILGLTKWATRSVEDTPTEPVIRGAKEGFVESLHVNISLIRRRIRTPKLKVKTLEVGDYSRTQVALTYMDGICDKKLIQEILDRVNRVSIDGVWDGGMIQEQIQDQRWSIFPQIQTTERPDTICAAMLEGRAALFFEGTPNVLIMPTTFFAFMQSPEDYYSGFIISTLLRILRTIFILIALLAPAFYIAVITFHQELIPTTLIMSVIQFREQVPFPAVVEAVGMEITFEGLREAGVRLPRQIGPAISIVGALVIGQAAIQASLVSPAMVIVVSITAIASFMIPHYDLSIAIRILRFPIMIIASMFGLLGVVLSVICIVIHLTSLRSFGIPYFEPFAPFRKKASLDSVVRAPLWVQKKNPQRAHGNGNQSVKGRGQKT